MNKIKDLLQKRQEYLLCLINQKKHDLLNIPEGSLRICGKDNKYQFYRRNDSKDTNGKYIKEQEMELVHILAQKDYDKKVLAACIKEQKAIEKYFSACPEETAEDVFEGMHKIRQKFIIPVYETDEQFIKKWESTPYIGKGFREDDPEFFSAKGERVRSKSEVMIADFLNREGIPYRYECPLKLRGKGVIHPDFTLLDVKNRKEIYLEHLGKMDDTQYAEYNLQRITDYEMNGIFPGERLIITHETKANPLNQKVLKNKILHYIS